MITHHLSARLQQKIFGRTWDIKLQLKKIMILKIQTELESD